MEAEERPLKKRRLSHDADSDIEKDLLQTKSISNNIDANGSAQEDDFQPTENGHEFNSEPPPLSKNQQKKLRKHLEWESKREERKVKRKEKIVAKRERNREKRKELAEHVELNGTLPAAKKPRPVQLPVTILIDCAFDDLMRDQERKSLATQITRSYSDTRASPYRPHLAICSFTGELRKRFDEVLSHYKGWKGVRFKDCDFVTAAEKAREWMAEPDKGGELVGSFAELKSDDGEAQKALEDGGEVVYLTSEADDVLNELKPYSTYIIGGLVDKNREKGVCFKHATKAGVRTARLPIGEFMDMQSRKVLTTNHVNEILLKWLECGDWGEAFMKVIPKRKGGMLKDDNESGEVENAADDGAEDAVQLDSED